MNKQDIFDNVDQYTSAELATLIKDGHIDLDELIEETDGYISRSMEQEIRDILQSEIKQTISDALEAHSIEEIEQVLRVNGDSISGDQRAELLGRIEQLKEEQEQQRLKEQQRQIALQWDSLRSSADVAELKRFREQHPQFWQINEVDECIEKLEWAPALREWHALRYSGSIEELEDLNRRYPRAPFSQDLKDRIDALTPDPLALSLKEELLEDIQRNKRAIKDTIVQALKNDLSIEDLLDLIEKDPNLINSKVIRSLETEGFLSRAHLQKVYPVELLKKYREGQQKIYYAAAKSITELQEPFCEVYIWGIPSSGKTCALGALLSTISTIYNDDADWTAKNFVNECQGIEYMTRLSQLFRKDQYNSMPESTHEGSIYEMSLKLTDRKGRVCPLSFIDLAGELFRAMYLDTIKEPLSEDLKSGLETLENIFRKNRKQDNRKLHFFVIEYGAHDREYFGLKQEIYLEAAANWLEKLGTFNQATDAIYILVTKSDKVKADSEQQRDQILATYLREHYQGFYNALKVICQRYDINNGELELLPFSIGEVYMQDFCKFVPDHSINIINTILDCAPRENSNSIFGKLLNLIRK